MPRRSLEDDISHGLEPRALAGMALAKLIWPGSKEWTDVIGRGLWPASADANAKRLFRAEALRAIADRYVSILPGLSDGAELPRSLAAGGKQYGGARSMAKCIGPQTLHHLSPFDRQVTAHRAYIEKRRRNEAD